MFDTPDIPTLRLCSMLASLAFAGMFVTFWSARRSAPELLSWAVSAAAYAAVILGFECVAGRPGPVMGFLLFSLLAGSDVLLLVGVNQFEGRRPLAPWMAVAAAPGLGFAIPAAFGLAAAPMPVWIATAGLLAIKGLVGMRLLDVADSRAPRGRRIAAVALLAYLPTYAFALAGELAGFAHLDLTAMVPMIADQLLLAAVNLGILSMLAEQAARALRDAALTDPLTGSWNRAWLDANRARLTAAGTGLILLDFDHFKSVNDIHGHHVGDDLLTGFAANMRSVLAGGHGALVRLGGDEFLVVLVGASPERTETLAINLLDSWRVSRDGGCTISAGYTCVTDSDPDLSTALARADRSLYRAKALGRNRVAA